MDLMLQVASNVLLVIGRHGVIIGGNGCLAGVEGGLNVVGLPTV